MIEYTVRVDRDRTEWYLNGQYHREDGPAVEFENGYKEWWLNGKRHRTDGPAVEWINGSKLWYQHDKLHREDGPAIERADRSREWYLNGQEYSEQDFNKLINCTELSIDEIEQLLGYKVKIVDK
jgi:hypothetical protein